MNYKTGSKLLLSLFVLAGAMANCSGPTLPSGGVPGSLKEVPAVRLNYRYEGDVPQPDSAKITNEERNAAIQADFDANRPQELLDRTLASPDAKRVLAIYHRANDVASEFRVDMYTGDGVFLRKVTSDQMAVHFPDTIRWSPDSSTAAFVAMLRGVSIEPETAVSENIEPAGANNTNSNTEPKQTDTDTDTNTTALPPTPAAPSGIMTFRTEQLYICNADGEGTKPITQNEGFIYFYYVWSPDSSMLAALALHSGAWKVASDRADQAGALFLPVGRPRIVEKSGRERRLDDGLTAVQPVWSPDSSKVATAFDTQIRVYDALGNNPTQAAIPLRNNLLLSSDAYDRDQASKLNGGNKTEPPSNTNTAPNTLPDPDTLVSFNPVVGLNWQSDELLYFQTAFIRRMKNEADSANSFARWHRLIFTPQANATN